MDRLDRLTERLVDDLNRQAAPPSGCVEPTLLERFVTGRVDAQARERVNAHLDACLACLNRFVELRDDLNAIAAPGRVSPRLRNSLATLLRGEGRGGFLRRAFAWRVPAWAVAGAAAVLLLTWVAVARYQRPGGSVEWPFPDTSSPARLTPAHSQTARTVSGVVSSVRDATSNGVEAHVVSLRDASGATYVLFAWGRPTVKAGESVEIDGIFGGASQSAGHPVYQGMATAVRRAR